MPAQQWGPIRAASGGCPWRRLCCNLPGYGRAVMQPIGSIVITVPPSLRTPSSAGIAWISLDSLPTATHPNPNPWSGLPSLPDQGPGGTSCSCSISRLPHPSPRQSPRRSAGIGSESLAPAVSNKEWDVGVNSVAPRDSRGNYSEAGSSESNCSTARGVLCPVMHPQMVRSCLRAGARRQRGLVRHGADGAAAAPGPHPQHQLE
jgi:hypothetical protein